MKKNIQKILIANRGEIACRIIKTARRLGVRTVAVFSDADANSLHVHEADEAYHIGPSASAQSYLNSSKIINVAKEARCHAIHPGYGFLSESFEFSDQCEKENIIFIGPPSKAIQNMGIKSMSKKIMASAGVPIIKGYHGSDQSNETLQAEANKIGFPLMIKAVRGGGGKGMRIANTAKEFLNQLQSARTESQKAFGDNSILLEQYIPTSRHVEVQVFADKYGNFVHLFERDCSVQRRHQKIIEEAPAPGVSEELRQNLGSAAVKAAKAVGYVGAGTVEFILNEEDLSFHFMEMNTRLQVEHPISEMITNTDLVEWQIRVASGEPLPLSQEQIKKHGHAFEARIYAENPTSGFLPGAGLITHLSTPKPTESVRIETGVRENDVVSVHYDPMIAKLVVWGETRDLALNALAAQLLEYHIAGLDTNVNFLIGLASHPSFRAGDVHTGFIEQHSNSILPPIQVSDQTICQTTAAIILNERNAARTFSMKRGCKGQPFAACDGFRINSYLKRSLNIESNDQNYSIQIKYMGSKYEIKINDNYWKSFSVKSVKDPYPNRFTSKLILDGIESIFSAVIRDNSIDIFNKNGRNEFSLVLPKFLTSCKVDVATSNFSNTAVVSPMPGIFDKIFVKIGDVVEVEEPIAVIIAMKMEYVLKAPKNGVIKSVNKKLGHSVVKGEIIVSFECDEQSMKN